MSISDERRCGIREGTQDQDSGGQASRPVLWRVFGLGPLLLSPVTSSCQGEVRSDVSAVLSPMFHLAVILWGFPLSFLYICLRLTLLSPYGMPGIVPRISFDPHNNPMKMFTHILRMRN